MADITVNGWIAEGGHTIIEGKNNIILFDVVEDINPIIGISDDIFNNNNAWFHCSLEIIIDDPGKISFIPRGYTLDRIQRNGRAWIEQKETDCGWAKNDIFLQSEQVCDYIKEGKAVRIKGQEFLLEGPDGKILRVIDVSEICFDLFWVKEGPKILKVPYKSGVFISKTYLELTKV